MTRTLALTKLGNANAAQERPILFSGEMVRAILEGRKTVTRRIIPTHWWRCIDPEHDLDDALTRDSVVKQCPFGRSGDKLWVRETWGKDDALCSGVQYRADWKFEDHEIAARTEWRWRPSIHMPRQFARILLEVESVRVEGLQEIGWNDLKAEGFQWELAGLDAIAMHLADEDRKLDACRKHWGETRWNPIYGKRGYSWASNPWVWVINFKRITP